MDLLPRPHLMTIINKSELWIIFRPEGLVFREFLLNVAASSAPELRDSVASKLLGSQTEVLHRGPRSGHLEEPSLSDDSR